MSFYHNRANPQRWINLRHEETAVTLASSFRGTLKAVDDVSMVKKIDASAVSKSFNIFGNAKANTIIGGAGNDKLYDEAGNDKILGGAGFVYGSGDGKDVITDYTAGQDKIKLASGSITVQNGKGKKITIVDAAGKTSTQTYSGAVSGRSALWFMEGDDNFITGATELSGTFRDSGYESAIGDLSVSSDIVNLTAELAPTAPIFCGTEKNQ